MMQYAHIAAVNSAARSQRTVELSAYDLAGDEGGWEEFESSIPGAKRKKTASGYSYKYPKGGGGRGKPVGGSKKGGGGGAKPAARAAAKPVSKVPKKSGGGAKATRKTPVPTASDDSNIAERKQAVAKMSQRTPPRQGPAAVKEIENDLYAFASSPYRREQIARDYVQPLRDMLESPDPSDVAAAMKALRIPGGNSVRKMQEMVTPDSVHDFLARLWNQRSEVAQEAAKERNSAADRMLKAHPGLRSRKSDEASRAETESRVAEIMKPWTHNQKNTEILERLFKFKL